MALGIMIEALVVLILFYLARSISKGNINMIHDYHTKNVRESDKKAYCSLLAKGLYFMGTAILISRIFIFMDMTLGVLLSLFIGEVGGMIIIHRAQMKYNGSWFS